MQRKIPPSLIPGLPIPGCFGSPQHEDSLLCLCSFPGQGTQAAGMELEGPRGAEVGCGRAVIERGFSVSSGGERSLLPPARDPCSLHCSTLPAKPLGHTPVSAALAALRLYQMASTSPLRGAVVGSGAAGPYHPCDCGQDRARETLTMAKPCMPEGRGAPVLNPHMCDCWP